MSTPSLIQHPRFNDRGDLGALEYGFEYIPARSFNLPNTPATYITVPSNPNNRFFNPNLSLTTKLLKVVANTLIGVAVILPSVVGGNKSKKTKRLNK